MKITIFAIIIALSPILIGNHAKAEENNNQAAKLSTTPADINNKWTNTQETNSNINTAERPFAPSDYLQPEKKNIMDYINKPELFFEDHSQQDQKYSDENSVYRHSHYEPVEYLKVPKLDSGITIKVGDF